MNEEQTLETGKARPQSEGNMTYPPKLPKPMTKAITTPCTRQYTKLLY